MVRIVITAAIGMGASLFALAAQPVVAPVPVPLARFASLELHGAGDVVVRHGAAQRVSLSGRTPAETAFSVDDKQRLTIDACARPCDGATARIEIVTPGPIEAIAVRGAGRIRSVGQWPRQGSIAVAANGGGSIDVTAMRADSVAAAVNVAGTLRVAPRQTLVAATRGGGRIIYRGTPAVTQVANGGGIVERSAD